MAVIKFVIAGCSFYVSDATGASILFFVTSVSSSCKIFIYLFIYFFF